MSISFDCACGRHFTVNDEYAGKRTKCPTCGAALVVPAPEAPPAPEPPASEEDAAYRALMDGPEPEPAPARGNSFDASEHEAPRKGPPAGKPLSSKKAAKFAKPSAEERTSRKERRASRASDPDRLRKILYMIGGGLMILFGLGVLALAFEGGAIRTGLFGGLHAFGGVGTLFQGITGNFDDDA